jgi:hypothetical protein
MKVVYASNTILLTDSQIGLFSLYLCILRLIRFTVDRDERDSLGNQTFKPSCCLKIVSLLKLKPFEMTTACSSNGIEPEKFTIKKI